MHQFAHPLQGLGRDRGGLLVACRQDAAQVAGIGGQFGPAGPQSGEPVVDRLDGHRLQRGSTAAADLVRDRLVALCPGTARSVAAGWTTSGRRSGS